MSNLPKHEHADWCNYKHGRCECGAVDQKQPKEATTPEPREWLIRKRGYYYRPNRAGYTASVAEAGRYTKAEAENEAALEPWHMAAVHESAVSEPRLPTSNECGWLIEWPADDNVPVRWWHPVNGWMRDASKGVRFSRKQDAEAYISAGKFCSPVVATEHAWGFAPETTDCPECKARWELHHDQYCSRNQGRPGEFGGGLPLEIYTNEAPSHPPILPERFNSVSLPEKASAECRCGCYSGGCGRPDGCRCDSSCPCQKQHLVTPAQGAWYCKQPNCRQLNSSWATTCGRCGNSRSSEKASERFCTADTGHDWGVHGQCLECGEPRSVESEKND